ncbi:MAG: winged helix-turn-helix domain-containing protein [Bacteroidia bacterium]|nr:winged helix-turn-helix domain-containing protein [Bacteroidia bacterium]
MATGKAAAVLSLLLASILLALPAAAPDPGMRPEDQARRMNLALRRTAHLLLAAAGDSSSAILPVQQTGPQQWQIRMQGAFDYDLLPGLLEASLLLHQIRSNYDAAVLSCEDGELQLGYTYLDFKQFGEVPCSGRSQAPGCCDLQVTCLPADQPAGAGFPWRWLLAGGCVLAAGLLAFRQPAPPQHVPSAPDPQDTGAIRLSRTLFEPQRLLLTVAGEAHTLTYREARLLELFARHPGEVLERARILDTVWGAEGVIVGRSVDVFVSRLRKLLRADPGLRLAAVHGVGYRLEVQA